MSSTRFSPALINSNYSSFYINSVICLTHCIHWSSRWGSKQNKKVQNYFNEAFSYTEEEQSNDLEWVNYFVSTGTAFEVCCCRKAVLNVTTLT